MCVPSYNYARFLVQCVESILRQAGVAVNLLVIDDASSDNTQELGERLALADPRMKFRRHAVNQGHIATYNEGIEWAEGDYFLLLSPDDVLTDGALARASALMDAHPEVGFVYGRQISFNSEVPSCSPADLDPISSGERIVRSAEFIEDCYRSTVNGVSTPTVVVRTALQKNVGGYRKELPHTGDLEMWLRMAAQVCSVGILGTAQAFRRRHDGAMHLTFSSLADIQQREMAFETVLREHGHRLADAEALRRMMRATLGDAAFWTASGAFEAGDLGTCQRGLEYAMELAPTLNQTQSWARLAWKRRLGPRLWRTVRAVVSHLTSSMAIE